MTTVLNDWAPETRSLLKSLTEAGFTIEHGDNGEYEFRLTNQDKFIEDLTACDEARLYVSKGGAHTWLYLVYGNSPGELVCDYGVRPQLDADLDAVVDTHYSSWSGRAQPTKTA